MLKPEKYFMFSKLFFIILFKYFFNFRNSIKKFNFFWKKTILIKLFFFFENFSNKIFYCGRHFSVFKKFYNIRLIHKKRKQRKYYKVKTAFMAFYKEKSGEILLKNHVYKYDGIARKTRYSLLKYTRKYFRKIKKEILKGDPLRIVEPPKKRYFIVPAGWRKGQRVLIKKRRKYYYAQKKYAPHLLTFKEKVEIELNKKYWPTQAQEERAKKEIIRRLSARPKRVRKRRRLPRWKMIRRRGWRARRIEIKKRIGRFELRKIFKPKLDKLDRRVDLYTFKKKIIHKFFKNNNFSNLKLNKAYFKYFIYKPSLLRFSPIFFENKLKKKTYDHNIAINLLNKVNSSSRLIESYKKVKKSKKMVVREVLKNRYNRYSVIKNTKVVKKKNNKIKKFKKNRIKNVKRSLFKSGILNKINTKLFKRIEQINYNNYYNDKIYKDKKKKMGLKRGVRFVISKKRVNTLNFFKNKGFNSNNSKLNPPKIDQYKIETYAFKVAKYTHPFFFKNMVNRDISNFKNKVLSSTSINELTYQNFFNYINYRNADIFKKKNIVEGADDINEFNDISGINDNSFNSAKKNILGIEKKHNKKLLNYRKKNSFLLKKKTFKAKTFFRKFSFKKFAKELNQKNMPSVTNFDIFQYDYYRESIKNVVTKDMFLKYLFKKPFLSSAKLLKVKSFFIKDKKSKFKISNTSDFIKKKINFSFFNRETFKSVASYPSEFVYSKFLTKDFINKDFAGKIKSIILDSIDNDWLKFEPKLMSFETIDPFVMPVPLINSQLLNPRDSKRIIDINMPKPPIKIRDEFALFRKLKSFEKRNKDIKKYNRGHTFKKYGGTTAFVSKQFYFLRSRLAYHRKRRFFRKLSTSDLGWMFSSRRFYNFIFKSFKISKKRGGLRALLRGIYKHNSIDRSWYFTNHKELKNESIFLFKQAPFSVSNSLFEDKSFIEKTLNKTLISKKFRSKNFLYSSYFDKYLLKLKNKKFLRFQNYKNKIVYNIFSKRHSVYYRRSFNFTRRDSTYIRFLRPKRKQWNRVRWKKRWIGLSDNPDLINISAKHIVLKAFKSSILYKRTGKYHFMSRRRYGREFSLQKKWRLSKLNMKLRVWKKNKYFKKWRTRRYKYKYRRNKPAKFLKVFVKKFIGGLKLRKLFYKKHRFVLNKISLFKNEMLKNECVLLEKKKKLLKRSILLKQKKLSKKLPNKLLKKSILLEKKKLLKLSILLKKKKAGFFYSFVFKNKFSKKHLRDVVLSASWRKKSNVKVKEIFSKFEEVFNNNFLLKRRKDRSFVRVTKIVFKNNLFFYRKFQKLIKMNTALKRVIKFKINSLFLSKNDHLNYNQFRNFYVKKVVKFYHLQFFDFKAILFKIFVFIKKYKNHLLKFQRSRTRFYRSKLTALKRYHKVLLKRNKWVYFIGLYDNNNNLIMHYDYIALKIIFTKRVRISFYKVWHIMIYKFLVQLLKMKIKQINEVYFFRVKRRKNKVRFSWAMMFMRQHKKALRLDVKKFMPIRICKISFSKKTTKNKKMKR